MTPDPPLLDARDISVAFGSRVVLDRVNLCVRRGEIAVILGPSGGGKSTLLRALATLQPVVHGQILLGGIESDRLAPSTYRARVAYVPQAPVMLAGTVADNVRAGPRLRGVELPDAEVDALLEEAALPPALRDRPSANLSGGEKQRVAMARAMGLAPRVLLFDEPTSALDPVAGRAVVELIGRCARGGCGVVVVTHDDELAAAVGGSHYICNDGRLAPRGG